VHGPQNPAFLQAETVVALTVNRTLLISDFKLQIENRPLTLTLSPEYRGEGTRGA